MSWDLHNPNLSFTFNFGKVGNLVLTIAFLFQTSSCYKIDKEVEPLKNLELQVINQRRLPKNKPQGMVWKYLDKSWGWEEDWE